MFTFILKNAPQFPLARDNRNLSAFQLRTCHFENAVSCTQPHWDRTGWAEISSTFELILLRSYFYSQGINTKWSLLVRRVLTPDFKKFSFHYIWSNSKVKPKSKLILFLSIPISLRRLSKTKSRENFWDSSWVELTNIILSPKQPRVDRHGHEMLQCQQRLLMRLKKSQHQFCFFD